MARKDQLEKLKHSFDKLDGLRQWHWLVTHKEEVLMVTLDKDSTSVVLKGDVDADFLLHLDDDCGNRIGTQHLLTLLGLPNEQC